VKLGGEPAKVGEESLKPGGEPAKVGGESLKPGGEPAKVGGESLKLGGEPAKVGGESLKAGGEPAKVGGEAVKVGEESLKVGGEPLKLGGEAVKVGGESLKLGGEAVEAGGEAVKLRAECAGGWRVGYPRSRPGSPSPPIDCSVEAPQGRRGRAWGFNPRYRARPPPKPRTGGGRHRPSLAPRVPSGLLNQGVGPFLGLKPQALSLRPCGASAHRAPGTHRDGTRKTLKSWDAPCPDRLHQLQPQGRGLEGPPGHPSRRP
jgi:hypothetical protein